MRNIKNLTASSELAPGSRDHYEGAGAGVFDTLAGKETAGF
jgi:hypothetical protein